MDKITLQQRIALWKSLPLNARGETDSFIDALIARVDELEQENIDLAYEILNEKSYRE